MSILNSSYEVTLRRLLPNRSIFPNITRCYQLNELEKILLRAGRVQIASFELLPSMCDNSKCNNRGPEGSITHDIGTDDFEKESFGGDHRIIRFEKIDLDCNDSVFHMYFFRAAYDYPHDCTFFLKVELTREDGEKTIQVFCFKMLI